MAVGSVDGNGANGSLATEVGTTGGNTGDAVSCGATVGTGRVVAGNSGVAVVRPASGGCVTVKAVVAVAGEVGAAVAGNWLEGVPIKTTSGVGVIDAVAVAVGVLVGPERQTSANVTTGGGVDWPTPDRPHTQPSTIPSLS